MLKEKIIKYYAPIYNYNCAETILYAANEEYDMKLDKNTFKTASAFGGGMGIESTCGAATGALLVIGILFTIDRAHESDKVKHLSAEFLEEFTKKLLTLNCRNLKEAYRNDDKRCGMIIDASTEILDGIVRREMK